MSLPNRLITSTSPYLLQHAYNPIHWYPWSVEALAKAQQEDKPIILSIGYAACHWCHVMAQETFVAKEIAAIMNAYFMSIKVDREENPDVDQIAIAAMQAMGLAVGWPLHVFLMPNQQPFYGGTYFSIAAWKKLLTDIAFAFQNHREALSKSSFYITKTLYDPAVASKIQPITASSAASAMSQQLFQKIYKNLDQRTGGISGAPKFCMPTISTFLIHYYQIFKDTSALDHLQLTLTRIACGGVYDHVGGGVYRYATDDAWTIPHFEKMLYDNAQMVSLYAHAYLTTKNLLYQQVVLQTMGFIEREMLGQGGGFYSSVDADSQGVEGAFYTWEYAEVEKLLQEDFPYFALHFNIQPSGNWHDGRNVLYRNPPTVLHNFTGYSPTIEEKLAKLKQVLYMARAKRPKPALDDQVIAAWNGMMLQALIDVYYAVGDAHFLELALKNATYLERYLIHGQQVWHSYSQGKHGQTGYLEDYAWVARGFISLYQATFQAHWLYQAEKLVQYALEHFAHEDNDLLYFTKDSELVWIKRTQEIFDQVIPSSNAVMAHTLFCLGNLLNQEAYKIAAQKMLHGIHELLQQEPLYMTHWAHLYLLQLKNALVITVIGTDKLKWGQVIKQHYPYILLAGTTHPSSPPAIAHDAIQGDETLAYICCATTCHVPRYSLAEVLQWLHTWSNNHNSF